MCFPASDTGPRRRNRNTYTCADKESVVCRYDVIEAGEEGELRVPRNGILLRPRTSLAAVIAGTQTSRDITKIVSGGPGKEYTFPRTIVSVCEGAFKNNESIAVVRLNEGLKALEESSF